MEIKFGFSAKQMYFEFEFQKYVSATAPLLVEGVKTDITGSGERAVVVDGQCPNQKSLGLAGRPRNWGILGTLLLIFTSTLCLGQGQYNNKIVRTHGRSQDQISSQFSSDEAILSAKSPP